MRLHVHLVHLLAFAAAVFISSLQAGRFYLSPWRHAAADLRRDSVVTVAGRRDLGYGRACSEHGQARESYFRFHVIPRFVRIVAG